MKFADLQSFHSEVTVLAWATWHGTAQHNHDPLLIYLGLLDSLFPGLLSQPSILLPYLFVLTESIACFFLLYPSLHVRLRNLSRHT